MSTTVHIDVSSSGARRRPGRWGPSRSPLPRCAARALWGAWLALAAGAGVAQAQSKSGTTFGQFVMIEPSARFTAMGNAAVGAAPDLEAAYFNPAAAARIDRFTLQFSHVAWIADIRHDYVAAALPLGRFGAGFAAVTSLGSGEIEVRTVNDPLGTGERYTVSDVAFGLGWAYALSERFAAGVQVRYVQETVWNSSAGALTFDVGTLYRLNPLGLHLGSSITNFGTSAGFDGRDLRITYDLDPDRYGDNGALPGLRFTQDYPVPVLFRVGVGYPHRWRPDLVSWLALSAAHPSDNTEYVNGGVEVTYRDLVSLRAGYQNLFMEDAEGGLAAGAGLRGRLPGFDYRVDYAWDDHGRLDSVHRVTFGLSF